jgi:hypothetical protein
MEWKASVDDDDDVGVLLWKRVMIKTMKIPVAFFRSPPLIVFARLSIKARERAQLPLATDTSNRQPVI